MLLSVPAKNLLKIPPLGPNLALCLLRKKVSTCTKLVFAYYAIIGGRCTSPQPHPGLGAQGCHGDSPQRSHKALQACVGSFLMACGWWNRLSILADFGRFWPTFPSDLRKSLWGLILHWRWLDWLFGCTILGPFRYVCAPRLACTSIKGAWWISTLIEEGDGFLLIGLVVGNWEFA